MSYPILEHDPTHRAVIEPSELLPSGTIPDCVVACFFLEVIGNVAAQHEAEVAFTFKTEFGTNPMYVFEHQGRQVAFFHPGLGAPLAAGFLEEAIALGGRNFIACGGAGVLNREIAVGHLVVPDEALRDEGTSYHYLPPSRTVRADRQAIQAIEAILSAHKVPYLLGKTWTTDAFYRETPGKVEQRRAEGCLTVEMEASAFFAVAQFRGVRFGQMLYGGDDVSSEKWDVRGWLDRKDVREQLFWLSVEACLALDGLPHGDA